MNQVAMNDFRREPEALLEAEIAACERVLKSGWWILGEEVREFEAAWASYIGAGAVVGCASGLDAIELGLRGLGIGEGDEVITTPMTAFATVLGVIRAGATAVLADIDPQTAMLSPESVRRCVSSRTKAILLVHLYGRVGPVEELGALASELGIHLAEDCAQAHGAAVAGRAAGGFGSFAAWSFYPTKNLGAVGDAGALSTADLKLAEKARSLRNYGQAQRYHHTLLGMNSRLDEMQAALLRERLRYLDGWIAKRREIAHRYFAGISSASVALMTKPEDRMRHAYHLFVVRCPWRSQLQAHLKACGVESLIHYPIPLHLQEPCGAIGRDPMGLAAAEEHANTCLSLPCHPALSDEEIDRVISAVNQFKV